MPGGGQPFSPRPFSLGETHELRQGEPGKEEKQRLQSKPPGLPLALPTGPLTAAQNRVPPRQDVSVGPSAHEMNKTRSSISARQATPAVI